MLSARDVTRMHGLHPDLYRVVLAMGEYCPTPFMVLEGVRSVAQQADYVAAGSSKTMNSRHLTGHAVDLAPLLPDGSIPWDAWPRWEAFAKHMEGAAAMCGVPVEWGGDWPKFPDGPHWQLPWDTYPAAAPEPEIREA
jgi:peptidoglycan L-alanyl-D-glutamate endopeptidase CwlK